MVRFEKGPVADTPVARASIELMRDLACMNEDETIAIARLARKMIEGSRKYGHIDIDCDPRSFLREALQEMQDAAHYINFCIIRWERILAQAEKQGLEL